MRADSMSTLSGTASKGEKTKPKFQSLDINSLYKNSRVSISWFFFVLWHWMDQKLKGLITELKNLIWLKYHLNDSKNNNQQLNGQKCHLKPFALHLYWFFINKTSKVFGGTDHKTTKLLFKLVNILLSYTSFIKTLQ